MVRWQRATFAVMVLGALIVYVAHSYAASEDAYKNVFIEHLEMGPATYLNINVHGKNAADIDKRLTEIYYGNELQPFWIEDGKPGPRAADILAVLQDAGFVQIEKEGRGSSSRSLCQVTKAGHTAFLRYLEELEQVLADAANGPSAMVLKNARGLRTGWSPS